MGKALKTLDRVKKWEIDEQRKILAEFLEAETTIEKALEKRNNDFEDEKKFYAENPGLGDFGAYTKKYLREKEMLEQMLFDTRKKIEKLQDIIAEMFKEKKTFSIIDENRTKRELDKEALEEQKFLDEIGTNNYIKNQE